MRVGLQIPSFTIPGGAAELRPYLARIAQTVDQQGFYSLWVMDHFFQIRGVGQPEEDMLEGYTTLGYLAGKTERVKLGTMVTGVVYRYPGILAKTVSTLDVLSGGRAYLGIGAAWNEEESLGLGVPFPPLKDRFEQLEETLQIIHQMWSDTTTAFNGKHYQLAQPINHPQPIHRPPILIGGMGENKTLRLIAKYGDACNFFVGRGMDLLKERLDLLKVRCEEVGRPYNEIEKTCLDTVDFDKDSVDAIIDRCRTLAGWGVEHYIFNTPMLSQSGGIERIIRELLPTLTELEPQRV
jgi:F420-dependent oxidoreductase-like protein